MQVQPTALPGVLLLEPKLFTDHRGCLFEAWQQAAFETAGICTPMVQDNISYSSRGVVRGLHFQYPNGQAKLVAAVWGEIYDVAVDVRPGSPSFGQWIAERLSHTNHRRLYIPSGFAHGFCVLSDEACVAYKCSNLYHPESAHTIAWNDPELAIPWPVKQPILSPKDESAVPLAKFPIENLPPYEPVV